MTMTVWIVAVTDSETHDWEIDGVFAHSSDAAKRRDEILDRAYGTFGEPHPIIIETKMD